MGAPFSLRVIDARRKAERDVPNDREPVGTYAQARQWLWSYSQVEEWAFDPDAALPLEALAICDIFWIDAETLRADLKREWGRL